MATMLRPVVLFALAVALALGMAAAQSPAAASSPGPAAGISDECLNAVLNMSDCLTYVTNGSTVRQPDKACCPELAGMLESYPICLCQLLAGGAESYGVVLDYKRTLGLLAICRLTAPPVSACAAFGVPVPMGVPSAAPKSAPSSVSNSSGLPPSSKVPDRRQKQKIKLILIVSVSAPTSLIVVACLIWIMCHRKGNHTLFARKHTSNEPNVEEILKGYDSLVPKRYTYSELKKITGSFRDNLGEGGYGMVFKGNLDDGRIVAVKLLKGSKGNGEEFLNEVVSIRRTSHVNIVNLLGFCSHGSKRALIFEYMANGSLDKYIYSEEFIVAIGWEMLQQIAIGIARGLEYLHRGCNARIIHFDIKPHNILLDENFCPKIADFGLAKLCNLKDSAISMAEARGTIGFIAPEVFSRGFGVVSTKSDVYSYGMVLLEMVGGRKNFKENAGGSSETYLPNLIYDCLVKDSETNEVTCEIEEIARHMALVGLWCIQTSPGNRPSISKAIEMLEKNINELEIPPKPFLSHPLLPPCFSS